MADDDKILSGTSDKPHWDPPVCSTKIRVVLYQNQMWVNRQSLLRYLNNEIARVIANDVPGVNEYWDHTKIKYLEGLKTGLLSLDFETREEIV